MEIHSEMCGQDNCGLDTSRSGAQAEPVSHRSGDRSYPPGMGLRPKACPRSRRETSPITQSERPWQGQVDRCLTLFRAMDPAPRGNGSSGSGALFESPIDAQSASPSQAGVILPRTRPGQSAGRELSHGGDVLPAVPKCGKSCFMCGAPCNRPLGKHFIRLADDNPAHLCCQHDLHELYGE